MTTKRLIVQADDFGMCHAVNQGIAQSFESGILTQTSVMAPCPWVSEAAALAAQLDLPIGVHGTLTCEWDFLRWRPLTAGTSLLESDGTMHRTLEGAIAKIDGTEAATELFRNFRSPAGESMVLDKNIFIANVLPASILRPLTDAEKEVYGRPYIEPGESRRPTLTWPRQIPLGGEPADVVEIVQDYANWLSKSELPKLLINADPGAILRKSMLEFCRTWPNQEEITVKGTHFIQEDSPDEIGRGVAEWLSRIS